MKYFFTIQKNLEYESKITYEEIIVLREARQNETTKRIEQIANQTKAQINKLKDRYRKILEDFDGKSNIVIIRLKELYGLSPFYAGP